MRAFAVFHLLGWMLAATAAAMLLPAAFAMVLDSLAQVQAFIVPAFVIGFLGGSLVIAFRGREDFTGRRENLLLLCLVWVVIPLAGALPLYTAGHPASLTGAVFESVSGFTTTGATAISDLSQTPRSVILWRALLQWTGGLTTLLSLATILGPLSGRNLLDRQLRLIGRSTHGTTRHMMDAIQSITPLYTALTMACFITLAAAGLPGFDAFCLSLSTLSTGGFMPRDGTIQLYGAPLAEFALAVFMLIGAISILWIRAILQLRWPLVREGREPAWIFALTLTTALVLGLYRIVEMGDSGWTATTHDMISALAAAASVVSTTGFIIASPVHDAMPYVVLLALCAIGGGRFSTAGGIKVYRVASMLRQLGRELRLLIYPHGVRASRSGEESRERQLFAAIWISMSAFVIAISALALALAGAGLSFSGALMAAVSAISNIGPAYDLARLGELASAPTYADMSVPAQMLLCVGMILGRVEILAFVSLANAAYWRH